ncbi:peptidase S41 [candidate division KSB3 bacterium]|nr:MAG: peptidase S41 [candidate division KSB3 bacterium]
MQKHLRSQHIIFLILALFAALVMGAGIADKVLATQTETYEKLKIFSEVLYLIQTNYVEDADIQDVIYGGINGMLKTLDPHSSFMPPDVYQEMQVETRGNFGGLGIQIGIKDEQLTVIAPIDDTPAFRAGVLAGDRIVKIEELPTRDMTLIEAVKLLRGPKGTQITISILREGFEKPKEFTITRGIIELDSSSHRMLSDHIGYIRLRQFQDDSADEIEEALRDLEEQHVEALILDLRSNPGGLLNAAVEVSDKFLEKGKLIVYTEGRKKNQDMRFVAHQEFTHPNYPMVVLVNHGSASASEIVSGALQDHSRAIIVGTQTYGKGSVQSVIPLSDNSGLRLTTARYYTPSGRTIHEKGITPDIIVPADQVAGAPNPEEEAAAEEAGDQSVSAENEEQTESVLDEEEETVNEESEEPESEESVVAKEVEMLLQKDVQLQRGVDVLRGILIFESQSI